MVQDSRLPWVTGQAHSRDREMNDTHPSEVLQCPRGSGHRQTKRTPDKTRRGQVVFPSRPREPGACSALSIPSWNQSLGDPMAVSGTAGAQKCWGQENCIQ